MARPRLDPTAPGENIAVVVSVETRARVIELSNERGMTRSAMVRELISRGLAELDVGENEQ